MVAIRFAGTEDDSHMPGFADDALDEQDVKLVYGNYKLTPKGQELVDYMRSVDYTKGQDELQRQLDATEPRDFRDAAVALVCAVVLIAAFVLAAVWGNS